MIPDNLKKTSEDINNWLSEDAKMQRLLYIERLAKEASLYDELLQIPRNHIKLWDYDKYWINCLALGKIAAMKDISEMLNMMDKREHGG